METIQCFAGVREIKCFFSTVFLYPVSALCLMTQEGIICLQKRGGCIMKQYCESFPKNFLWGGENEEVCEDV